MSVFVILGLLVCMEAQGSSAVTPVFVKKGGDVLLEVINADDLKDFSFVEWKFKKTAILVRFAPGNDPHVFPNYIGRLEFPVKNYSVNLKNLQHTDSGVYTAQVPRLKGDQILAEYSVTVQDPVSPVDLKVGSVSNSSNSCNVTVTCSTQDSHINSTFTCDTQSCSQEGGKQSKVSTSGASLQVYLDLNGSIICNHSNQVSRTEDIKNLEDFCPRRDDPKQLVKDASVTMIVVLVVAIPIVIVIIIIAAVVRCRKKGKYDRKSIENTVYEVPQIAATAPTPDQRPTYDVVEICSTYATVGPHTGTVVSTEMRDKPLPESLYAQVEKPGKPLKK